MKRSAAMIALLSMALAEPGYGLPHPGNLPPEPPPEEDPPLSGNRRPPSKKMRNLPHQGPKECARRQKRMQGGLLP